MLLLLLLLCGDDRGTGYGGRKQTIDSPDHTGTVQVGGTRGRRGSVTVKLNGVDCGGDGAAAVASPLLLRLFMAE